MLRFPRCLRHAALCALPCLVALTPPAAHAILLPSGFSDSTLPFSFSFPTDLAFLPDGRMVVAEKRGQVWIVDAAGAGRTLLWDGQNEVLNNAEVGLMGVTVHPDFANHPWLFLLYTCDPDSGTGGQDTRTYSWGRLTRYTFTSPSANTLSAASRTVLIGKSWADGWVNTTGHHHVDDLAWGRDGTLFVSAGDGSTFEFPDAGGEFPEPFAAGRFPASEDIGAFRAQNISSLSGKVLRIDPATGLGLSSNPYWDGNGGSVRSRVWGYGFRNPYRLAFKPLTGVTDPSKGEPGTLYVGDVGWDRWEELSVAQYGGINFGWPCREGLHTVPEYIAATPPTFGCATLNTPANPGPVVWPVLDYSHTTASNSSPPGTLGDVIIGGVFYDAYAYPDPWRRRFFYGDTDWGWIRAVQTNAADQVVNSLPFADEVDAVVSFAASPLTGDLWYASVWSGQVHRIRYTGTLDAGEPAPPAFALSAARPNPTRAGIRLAVALPSAADVALAIVDPQGRSVWSGASERHGAGDVRLEWNGLDRDGAPVPPGLYFARVTVDRVARARRFAVVR